MPAGTSLPMRAWTSALQLAAGAFDIFGAQLLQFRHGQIHQQASANDDAQSAQAAALGRGCGETWRRR
jgi:hypothetical protein